MIELKVDQNKKLVLDDAAFKPFVSNHVLKEMEDILLDLLMRKGSFEDLISKLHKFKDYPAACNYMYARFYLVNQNYEKAKELIDSAIYSIEKGNEIYEDTMNGNIYATAGQIYASLKKYKESLRAYQDYQLCITRVKSVDTQDGLLSFRRINEYSLSDLINNEVTVCSPRVMNDPYDSLILKWGEYMLGNEDRKPHIDYLVKSFESYRIRSFTSAKDENGSELINNILMWSHYAGEHTGFCVKYNFSKFFLKTDERHTTRFQKVIYAEPNEKINIQVDTISTKLGLFTKHNDWKYENEIRLISYQPDTLGPFYSIPLDEDSCIDSIYFGYKCSEKNIETIKRILSKNSNIKYFKMASDYNDILRLKPSSL